MEWADKESHYSSTSYHLLATSYFSIVTRNRLDGADHFFVGDLVGGADKGGVAAVHQDGTIALSVAAQGVDQLPPLRVVEGTEVHGQFSFPKKRTTGAGLRSSGPGRQLREQEVDAAVKAVITVLDREHFATTHDVVAHLLLPHQNPNGIAALSQGKGEDQPRAPLIRRYFESQSRLLLIQAFDPFRVGLQHRPERVQRTCQIRPDRHLHRHGAIIAGAVPQRVPGKPQGAKTLHVWPGLVGEECPSRAGGIRGTNSEDALLTPQ